MGLDMTASRRLCVKQWDHQRKNERFTVRVTKGGRAVSGIQPSCISVVEEEVMYWRNAHHIHRWFVDNVQGGEDNCATYDVEWESLESLHSVCEKVISASKLVVVKAIVHAPSDKEHPNGRSLSLDVKMINDVSVAAKLLPTKSDFFFGSDEYDEDYLNDVKATAMWAARMIADHKAGVPGDICYSSS